MSPFFHEYGNSQGLLNVLHSYIPRKPVTDGDGKDIYDKMYNGSIIVSCGQEDGAFDNNSSKVIKRS